MKIIIGLGNPGKEYAMTRHNAGFMALDALFSTNRDTFSDWTKKYNADIAEGVISNTKVLLMKPHTFMNTSGEALAPAVGFFKLTPADVIAVYDEADIPFGTFRVRNEGSAAGHNGVKSLIAALGTDKFTRIRIGIGDEIEKHMPREDFVLQKFTTEEQEKLPDFLKQIRDEIIKAI